VPINVQVGEKRAIGGYDDIREYVRQTRGPFGVMNGVCRQARELPGGTCSTAIPAPYALVSLLR
jgi:hypothetical protein